MNNFYLGIEPKIFCLLVIVYLCIFREKNFQFQCLENKLLCCFSFAAIFFSVLGDIVNTQIIKNLCLFVCGFSNLFAMYYGCVYVFCAGKKLEKVLLAILSVAFGVFSFYALRKGVNITSFILLFAVVALFVTEQHNKIRQDSLTKLYNRYGMDAELKEQLKQYEREHTDSFYIIACDLDNFKHINDTWGHPEGDRALVLVAGALSRVGKKFDAEVFRIGGDEFVIITDKSDEGLATAVTDAIVDELNKIEFRDDFDINMSIGTALYDGVTSIDDLLNNADKKLYEAKKNKK